MEIGKILYILFVLVVIYIAYNVISTSFRSIILIALGVIIGLYFYNNLNNMININYVVDTIKKYKTE
jgi:hypothetical protein